MVVIMTFAKVVEALGQVAKDPVAWAGGTVAGIRFSFMGLSFSLPTTLLDWSALAVSLATFVYVVTKLIILLKTKDGKKRDMALR